MLAEDGTRVNVERRCKRARCDCTIDVAAGSPYFWA